MLIFKTTELAAAGVYEEFIRTFAATSSSIPLIINPNHHASHFHKSLTPYLSGLMEQISYNNNFYSNHDYDYDFYLPLQSGVPSISDPKIADWGLDCLNSNYIASTPGMDVESRKDLKISGDNARGALDKQRIIIETIKCLHSLYFNHVRYAIKKNLSLNQISCDYLFIIEQVYDSLLHPNLEGFKFLDIYRRLKVCLKKTLRLHEQNGDSDCGDDEIEEEITSFLNQLNNYGIMLEARKAIDVSSKLIPGFFDPPGYGFDVNLPLSGHAKNFRLAIVKYISEGDSKGAWELRFSKKIFRRILWISKIVSYYSDNITYKVDVKNDKYLKIGNRRFYADDYGRDMIEVTSINPNPSVLDKVNELLYGDRRRNRDVFNERNLSPGWLVNILRDSNKQAAVRVIEKLLPSQKNKIQGVVEDYYKIACKDNEGTSSSKDTSGKTCSCGKCFNICPYRLSKTIEILCKWKRIVKTKYSKGGSLLLDFMLYECMGVGVPIIGKYKEQLKNFNDYKELRDRLLVLLF